MCHHNLNVHNVIFWILQCRTLNNFNKLSVIIVIKNKKLDNISNIMRKRQGVFTKKMYDLFFEMQLKLKTCQNLNLRFQKIISGTLYTCYIYILTTRAIEVTQLYIRCKFYPIKKKILFCKNSNLKQALKLFGSNTVAELSLCMCFIPLEVEFFL